MTLNGYQEAAHRTSQNTEFAPGDRLTYPITLLGSEAGECLSLLQKLHRDNGGKWGADDARRLTLEAGDALWAIAEIATQLGITLEQVADANIEKLADRAERGVISGSGDDR